MNLITAYWHFKNYSGEKRMAENEVTSKLLSDTEKEIVEDSMPTVALLLKGNIYAQDKSSWMLTAQSALKV